MEAISLQWVKQYACLCVQQLCLAILTVFVFAFVCFLFFSHTPSPHLFPHPHTHTLRRIQRECPTEKSQYFINWQGYTSCFLFVCFLCFCCCCCCFCLFFVCLLLLFFVLFFCCRVCKRPIFSPSIENAALWFWPDLPLSTASKSNYGSFSRLND